MKLLLKLILALVLLVVLVVGGGVAYLFLRYPKVGPAKELKIESTPEMLERGKYLVENVAGCLDCHSKRDPGRFAGPVVPGTEGQGGQRFELNGYGEVYSANITPTGIGNMSDGELFRTLTTGVSANGTPLFPIMPYLSYRESDPEDIKAMIAYIRTLAPNTNQVPARHLNFPLNLVVRMMPREAEPGKRPPATDTVAYGKYLVNLGICGDCHTPTTDRGEPLPGMELAGGMEFEMRPPSTGLARAANITPDVETGIGGWNKAVFIQRFKAYTQIQSPAVGKGEANSSMPWFVYAGMTEEDLGAIYDYLRTVKPVKHQVVRFAPNAN